MQPNLICSILNCLSFGETTFNFCNVELKECASIVHLGHRLFSNLKGHNTDGVNASFYRQYNMFKGKFGGLASSVKAELFHKYCASFYGCLLLPFH